MLVKNISKKLTILFAYGVISIPCLADVVLVIHPSNDSTLDAKEVKRIFLGKAKKFSNGKEAIPINQVEGSAARKSFDSTVLGRSSNQVSAYWSKLVFTGKGIPPKEVENDAAVIALIAENANAVGYVDESSVSASVKAIKLK